MKFPSKWVWMTATKGWEPGPLRKGVITRRETRRRAEYAMSWGSELKLESYGVNGFAVVRSTGIYLPQTRERGRKRAESS